MRTWILLRNERDMSTVITDTVSNASLKAYSSPHIIDLNTRFDFRLEKSSTWNWLLSLVQ